MTSRIIWYNLTVFSSKVEHMLIKCKIPSSTNVKSSKFNSFYIPLNVLINSFFLFDVNPVHRKGVTSFIDER